MATQRARLRSEVKLVKISVCMIAKQHRTVPPHPLVATSTEQPPAKGAISGTSLFLFTSGVTITKLLKISSEKYLITKIVRLAVECFLS